MTRLRVLLLGPPRFMRDEVPVAELVSLKAQALLIHLACTDRPVSRPALAALLWGEMPEEAARANLRQILTKLRKAVADCLVIEGNAVALHAGECWCDAVAFAQALEGGAEASPEGIRAALALYRGHFLEGFHLDDAPEFEAWASAQRERLRGLAVGGWCALARCAGDGTQAMAALRQALRLEPWNEEAHRELMEALARAASARRASP